VGGRHPARRQSLLHESFEHGAFAGQQVRLVPAIEQTSGNMGETYAGASPCAR
jgi:hypothetical protein